MHVQKGENCVGIDLDRSMKTFGFKNLGLDRLIGDNKKFCWHLQEQNNELLITYTCLRSRFYLNFIMILS